MHNIDRTQPETWETYEFGPSTFGLETGETSGYGEYEGETGEMSGYGEYTGETGETSGYGEFMMESPLGEEAELALTAELLEINSEAELDHFLGSLIKSVSRAAGNVISSPIGNALGGVLKSVAKKALPVVGGALGTMVAPGLGTAVGTALGSMASRAFEFEGEGLSGEDREFESARQFVRFASAAAQQAARMPGNIPPRVAVPRAIRAAAQQFAPGLLNVPVTTLMPTSTNGSNQMTWMGMPDQPVQQGMARTGRWIRQGRNIVLLGAYRHS
jgi:uncharacterized protein (DUF697 family)